MKYVIVEDGGKQYKAAEGEIIEVDLFPAEIDDQIDLERVLLVCDDGQTTIGTPTVPGVKVQATVVGTTKAPKVIVFKYLPKKRYRAKTGHRQQYTRLRIDKIVQE